MFVGVHAAGLANESWRGKLAADGEVLTRDHSITGENLSLVKSVRLWHWLSKEYECNR